METLATRMRTLTSNLIAGAALAALALPASAAVEVRRLEDAVAVAGQRLVAIDAPVGTVRVEAGPAGRIEIAAAVSCSRLSRRCRELAEDLELVTRARGSSVEIAFEGYPNASIGGVPKLDVTVRMPPELDLELELGVGDVRIAGITGDLAVDLGVGDVEIRVPEAAVRSVALDVGVGGAEIDPEPRGSDRSGFLFLGNERRWHDGPGESDIEIDVGVGEATVTFE